MISKSLFALIFVVFVIEGVYCKPNPNCDDGGKGGGGGLEVVISFDSLDSKSKQFFSDKLKPIYDEMSKCVKWHFIPCSTSHIVQNVLQCKDGVEECQIDALHACAAHYYESDENNLGKFFLCMMASGDQMCNAQKCATDSGLDWNKLKGCKPCNEAGQWCDNRWKQLNMLHEPNIPGVLFDMKYNADSENEAMCDLKSAICNQIKKKNLQCAACGGSGGNGPDNGGKPSGGGGGGGGGDDGKGNPPPAGKGGSGGGEKGDGAQGNPPPSGKGGSGGGEKGDGGQGNPPPSGKGGSGGGGGDYGPSNPPEGGHNGIFKDPGPGVNTSAHNLVDLQG